MTMSTHHRPLFAEAVPCLIEDTSRDDDCNGDPEETGCAGCPECRVCDCDRCQNERALDNDADAFA